MPLIVQTNIASLEAQRNLSKAQTMLQSSFAKLSSGYRINGAADDAAGLAISESMQSQIRSYTVAERNANDGISMAQTAEGALGQIQNILARMRELGVQGSNGSLGTADRSYLDTEYQQLKAEISRIQASTKFNGNQLLGSAGSPITFQIGLDNTSSDQISLTFGGLTLTALLSTTSLLSGTAGNSLSQLSVIDSAMKTISTQRANYGAAMNRLQVTTSNLETIKTNLSAANSRIRDVDVAEETASLSRAQVLSQAGAAVLAQANQMPQTALKLLGG